MLYQEHESVSIRIERAPSTVSEGTLHSSTARSKTAQKRVWIDLDNSPHVPFFAPIIKELENRGHTVFVTARDFAQVTELAELMHLRYKTIGRHYGKHKL